MTTPAAAENFHDRDGFIWLDGRLVRWREAKLHVLTHALHYGSAVFEGQRAYGGNIFKLTEHIERLIASARARGFALPWTREEIEDACVETVEMNDLADCYVRPIAWRGSEQMSVSGRGTEVHLAIACWSWDSYFKGDALERGLRLDIAQYCRPSAHTAPTSAKASALYAICTLAKDQAEASGFDDALMLDWRGQIAEATGANVFFARDNVLYTPIPDCFLDGITRRTVIWLAGERRLEVVERAIWPEELIDFDECFLTGTAVEVAPVAQIGPWAFKTGYVTDRLQQDYATLVRSASRRATKGVSAHA